MELRNELHANAPMHQRMSCEGSAGSVIGGYESSPAISKSLDTHAGKGNITDDRGSQMAEANSYLGRTHVLEARGVKCVRVLVGEASFILGSRKWTQQISLRS